jgi:membrane-bound metal-dependent hydrolase YbcI (DUF457 family)
MTYKTHTTFALALSFSPILLPGELNFIQDTNIMLLPFIFVTIFFFSLAPDFDEPGSYLSRKPPWNIVSLILSSIFPHRGATHWLIASIFPPAIMFFSLKYFGKVEEFWILIYFAWISYVAHSLGDGFTVSGVRRYFYPFSKATLYTLPKFLRFKTGTFVETLWLLFFSLISILELYLFVIKTENFSSILKVI